MIIVLVCEHELKGNARSIIKYEKLSNPKLHKNFIQATGSRHERVHAAFLLVVMLELTPAQKLNLGECSKVCAQMILRW